MATDLEARRLLAAIYPTRLERVLGAVVTWAYRPHSSRPRVWLGHRGDDLRLWLQRRRVAKVRSGKDRTR